MDEVAGTLVRAAVLEAPGRLVVREVELPPVGVGDVVVRVEACGICATNLHGWSLPPAGPATLPGAHGHEVAGVVAAVGEKVSAVAVGDRVCLEPAAACGCGACEACRAGDPMRCRAQTLLPVWGFAEAVVVPERGVVPVPEGLAAEVASLAEPLASAVHGIRHSHTAASAGRVDGARVLVLGAGPLGLLAVAAARALGAAEVTAVARHDHQARVAESLGAGRVVRDRAADLAGVLRRLRADLVVEAAGGSARTLEQAFAAVDRGGEVIVLGLFDAPQPVDVTAAVMRNVRAFFAAAYATRDGVADIAVALDLLRAEPALAGLVTHVFPLAAIAEARATAADKRSRSLRVVVRPSEAPVRPAPWGIFYQPFVDSAGWLD